MNLTSRRTQLIVLLASSVIGAWAGPAAAQTKGAAGAQPAQAVTPEDEPEASDGDETKVSEVAVVAHREYARLPGAVTGAIEPEIQYNAAQIQALGVSTVSELLGEIEPQTRSERGAAEANPVVLLNGRRISSLNEVMNFPTEAIQRVDILPPEAALSYGYPPNERVLNIVLRRHFRAMIAGLEGGGSDGGREIGTAEASVLHVDHDDRLNLDLKYKGASEVTEAERGIIQPAPSTPYALAGNVVSPSRGAQIDPALSALAGRPVIVAGVPAVASLRPPMLEDFLATAGVPNATDVGSQRTLAPATQSLAANAVFTRTVFDDINATLNASLGGKQSGSLRGLPGVKLLIPAGNPFSPFASDVLLARYVDSPLRQDLDSWNAHLGSVLYRQGLHWRISLTATYDHVDSQTATDAGVDASALQALVTARSASVNPFAPWPVADLSQRPRTNTRSISDAGDLQLVAAGPLLTLPAGGLNVSGKLGVAQDSLKSTQALSGAPSPSRASRSDQSGQLSVELPLASRKHAFLPAIGELSVDAHAAFEQVSDVGFLRGHGFVLNWTPVTGYNLIASYSEDQIAPTLDQLGAPMVSTPGVRLFDYSRGQTVEITQLSGGNPMLEVERRRVLKIGLTLRPFQAQDLTVTANYVKSDIRNPIMVLPAVTPDYETAFSDRFARDPAGDLVQEDDRPVNLARWQRTQVRWGINYSHRFAPASGIALPGRGSSQTDGGNGAGAKAGRAFRPPSTSGGRIQFALYHTIYLADRQTLRPGGPVVDLLNGAPAPYTSGQSYAGGQYAQEVEAQLGATRHGLGARLTADWRQGTIVMGTPGLPTADLRFSDRITLNARLFANFSPQSPFAARHPWLVGTRLSLNVTNLLDQHLSVHDALGGVPLRYQAGNLDPYGRTVTLGVRKLFR